MLLFLGAGEEERARIERLFLLFGISADLRDPVVTCRTRLAAAVRADPGTRKHRSQAGVYNGVSNEVIRRVKVGTAYHKSRDSRSLADVAQCLPVVHELPPLTKSRADRAQQPPVIKS